MSYQPSLPSHLTVDGLVLRATPGENRLLTILTAEHGVVRAFANKAGTMRSRISAAAEVLSWSRFVLFTGRGRTVVDKADTNRIFFGLRESWRKLCLATFFVQLAAELCPEGESAAYPLRLTLNALHFLEKDLRDERLLKAVYELRLLTLTGFMPDLVGCAACGAGEAEGFYFFPSSGELICGSCLLEQALPGGMLAAPDVLLAMRHIIYSPAEKLFSFTLGEPAIEALSRLSEGYLLAQVEKSFSAMEALRGCEAGLGDNQDISQI
jgi:DNA repair protein RecO (recombination protein O)